MRRTMPRWTTFFAAAGRRPWLLVPLLLAIAVAAWAWSRTRATPVPVLTVRAAPLTQSLAVSGRVASETRVFVGSTLTGRVAEVTRREGGTLAAGELIVRLEDAELAAAARQAAAAREVERNEQLLAQGFIGQARLDEAKRAADVARAVLRAAQVQREANVSGSELVTAEARVTEARAALELARARLAQTRIAAPAEATVLARHVEPGQIVQPGTRLVELSVRGPLQLVALVDEKYLARLAPGMAASVVADAFPGRPFEARIASIAPLVDALRGAVEVKFSLPAPPSPPVRLTNDMTVSIEVVTAKRERAIALPGEAVRAGPAVLVVQGGAATLRPVQTGLRTLAAVEVTQGLREGEQVVLDAAIAPGARVRAVERTAAAAAGEGLDVGAAMRGLGRD